MVWTRDLTCIHLGSKNLGGEASSAWVGRRDGSLVFVLFMQGGLGGSLRALRYVGVLDFESAFLEGSGDDGDWPARAYEAVSRSRLSPTHSLTRTARSRHFARVVRRHPSCRMR